MAASERPPGAHPPTEQYLEALLVLEGEGVEVIQARLAERVGHSAPTVSEMVRRLKEAGYVNTRGRVLSLTSAGRQLATSVLRKHCLVGRLMTDVIGLPWCQAHAEADRWEHVISDEVEARLVEVLGNPTTCPHGNPIPGTSARPGRTALLADAEIGQRVCLARVLDVAKLDMEALAYLDKHHCIPGCQATVTARDPDGSLVLKIGDSTIGLGASIAKLLCVTPAG
ncbi:MAG TPA: metal-dependent transcriptional regulator [Acidimicrobiales bacterium]|nr:metal-dependent transcriptional regulator [Acidimicrobiales bacterium]